MRNGTRRRIWLTVPCLLLAQACGEAAPRGRVLLIGIDGASPRITGPLIEQGRLPNLAAIADRGVYAPLRAHAPISSPRIWTSIATGKNPNRHGIVNFAYEDEAGEQQLFLGSDRVGQALWNIASDAGLRVAVVNWWNTYPLEIVNGVMICDHLLSMDIEGRRRMTGAQTATVGAIAHPPDWDEQVGALLADDTPLTRVSDPFAERSAFPRWVRPARLTKRYANDADVIRIALAVEAETRPDLMMVFLPGIDRVSHVLWGAIEPAEAYEKPPRFEGGQREHTRWALERYYEYTDALIGLLAARYGPDALVMVVSDHGFEASRGLGFLTGGHNSPQSIDGVVFASGPGIGVPERGRRTSVNDVTPTILTWLGLPVARNMDGRPASFLLDARVEYVASYDGNPIERLDPVVPSGAEDEILDQLRALGYLEGDAGVERAAPE